MPGARCPASRCCWCPTPSSTSKSTTAPGAWAWRCNAPASASTSRPSPPSATRSTRAPCRFPRARAGARVRRRGGQRAAQAGLGRGDRRAAGAGAPAVTGDVVVASPRCAPSSMRRSMRCRPNWPRPGRRRRVQVLAQARARWPAPTWPPEVRLAPMGRLSVIAVAPDAGAQAAGVFNAAWRRILVSRQVQVQTATPPQSFQGDGVRLSALGGAPDSFRRGLARRLERQLPAGLRVLRRPHAGRTDHRPGRRARRSSTGRWPRYSGTGYCWAPSSSTPTAVRTPDARVPGYALA